MNPIEYVLSLGKEEDKKEFISVLKEKFGMKIVTNAQLRNNVNKKLRTGAKEMEMTQEKISIFFDFEKFIPFESNPKQLRNFFELTRRKLELEDITPQFYYDPSFIIRKLIYGDETNRFFNIMNQYMFNEFYIIQKEGSAHQEEEIKVKELKDRSKYFDGLKTLSLLQIPIFVKNVLFAGNLIYRNENKTLHENFIKVKKIFEDHKYYYLTKENRDQFFDRFLHLAKELKMKYKTIFGGFILKAFTNYFYPKKYLQKTKTHTDMIDYCNFFYSKIVILYKSGYLFNNFMDKTTTLQYQYPFIVLLTTLLQNPQKIPSEKSNRLLKKLKFLKYKLNSNDKNRFFRIISWGISLQKNVLFAELINSSDYGVDDIDKILMWFSFFVDVDIALRLTVDPEMNKKFIKSLEIVKSYHSKKKRVRGNVVIRFLTKQQKIDVNSLKEFEYLREMEKLGLCDLVLELFLVNDIPSVGSLMLGKFKELCSHMKKYGLERKIFYVFQKAILRGKTLFLEKHFEKNLEEGLRHFLTVMELAHSQNYFKINNVSLWCYYVYNLLSMTKDKNISKGLMNEIIRFRSEVLDQSSSNECKILSEKIGLMRYKKKFKDMKLLIEFIPNQSEREKLLKNVL